MKIGTRGIFFVMALTASCAVFASNNSNSHHHNNSNEVGSASANANQLQLQGQKQSISNSGNSKSSSSVKNSGNSANRNTNNNTGVKGDVTTGSNTNQITVQGDTYQSTYKERYQAPGIGGPASGPCTGFSGGLAVPGFGVNGAKVDKECEKREAIRVLSMIGMHSEAKELAGDLDVLKDLRKRKQEEREAAEEKAASALRPKESYNWEKSDK